MARLPKVLKQQQNLLVDFGAFPGSIKELCDRCDADGDGKFRLVLKPTDADSILSFTETNPFRELCHLSLKMCRGTDSQVRSEHHSWQLGPHRILLSFFLIRSRSTWRSASSSYRVEVRRRAVASLAWRPSWSD